MKRTHCICGYFFIFFVFILSLFGGCHQQAILSPRMSNSIAMTIVLDSSIANAALGRTESVVGVPLRTILPTNYLDLSTLVYYIKGTSTNSAETLPLQRVQATVDPATGGLTGTVSVALDKSVSWDLTLWACVAGATNYTLEADVNNNAVLKGRSYANLGAGGDVYFVLSTDGLTKNGSINLSIYGAQGFPKSGYHGGSEGKFEIRGWRKGDSSHELYFSNNAFHVVGGQNTTSAQNKFTWSRGNIKPGVWYFDFVFQWPGEIQEYYYTSEDFVIYPGVETIVDLAIPNFIGNVPADPSNFYAGYGSEKVEGLFADQYLVYFSWEHPRTDHNGFEIEFCELAYKNNDFGTVIDTDTEWSQYTVDGKFFIYNDVSFQGSRWRNTGGLSSTDRQCTMWLDMGKRYLFRIRAVNGDGNSAWVYLSNLGIDRPNGSYQTTDPWPNGLTKNEAPRNPSTTYNGSSGLFPGWTVNRAAINFDIGPYGKNNLTRFKRNGKDLVLGVYVREFYSQGRPGTSIQVLDYHEAQDGSTLVIKYPKGGANQTFLSKWHFWNKSTLFPNATRSAGNWDGYQNLYLYASFEQGQATNAIEYLPQREWINFNNRLLSADSFTPTGPDDVQVISLSKAVVGVANVPLVITVPTNSKPHTDNYIVYSNITVKVQSNTNYGIMYGKSQSAATWGQPTTFQISGIDDWAIGSYRVMVEMKTNQYWLYRYYFDINLTA